MFQQSTASKPVVVAVDGSAESESALRWALEHADTHGLGVKIVTCYQHHIIAGESAGISWEQFESTKSAAKQAAECAIQAVAGADQADHILALGPVDAVLADHSRDASLVVVGTRSTTRLRQAVLGSTTNRITGTLACPVVSIPLETCELEGAAA